MWPCLKHLRHRYFVQVATKWDDELRINYLVLFPNFIEMIKVWHYNPLSPLLTLLGFVLFSSWSSEFSGFLVSPSDFLEVVWIGLWNEDCFFSCAVIVHKKVSCQVIFYYGRDLTHPCHLGHSKQNTHKNLPLRFPVCDLPRSLQLSSILPLLINSLWSLCQGVASLL